MPSKNYPHPEERSESASQRTPDGNAVGRRIAEAARPIVLVAAGALIDADGRVLLAERPPGKYLAGLWEFPGGKVQPGETPELALIRELGEELGIDVVGSCLAPFTFAPSAVPD